MAFTKPHAMRNAILCLKHGAAVVAVGFRTKLKFINARESASQSHRSISNASSLTLRLAEFATFCLATRLKSFSIISLAATPLVERQAARWTNSKKIFAVGIQRSFTVRAV